MDSTRLCTACRRRPAIYKRTYSGDLLCSSCLERALERAVRRSLGETGLLRPRTRLLVPITLSMPGESIALARIVPRVERSYGSETIIAAPASLDIPESLIPKGPGTSMAIINLEVETPDRRDPIACARLERRWALEAARRLGAHAAIMPYTRTDLALLLLHAVLSGNPHAVSEALPYMPWTSPPLVTGFHRAEGEIVAAYKASRGITVEPACIPDLSLAKLVFYSIAGRRPELEFSFLKSLDLLASPQGASKCTMCGGYTGSGPVCEYCSHTRVRLEIASSH